MTTEQNLTEHVLRFCPHCGGNLLPGASFCHICGLTLEHEHGSESPLGAQTDMKKTPDETAGNQAPKTMISHQILTCFVLPVFEFAQLALIFFWLYVFHKSATSGALVDWSRYYILVNIPISALLLYIVNRVRISLKNFHPDAMQRLFTSLLIIPILAALSGILLHMSSDAVGHDLVGVVPAVTIGYLTFCLFNVFYYWRRYEMFTEQQNGPIDENYKFCRSCGKILPKESVYCAFCGRNLSTGERHAKNVEPTENSVSSESELTALKQKPTKEDMPAEASEANHSPKITLGIVVCAVILAILVTALIFWLNYQKTSSAAQNSVANIEEVLDSTPTPSVTETPEPEPTDSGNPENGAVLYNRYGDLSATLLVQNNTAKDCCICLFEAYGVAQVLYVRAGLQAEFTAPKGSWTVQVAVGDIWQDKENFFGPQTCYYTMNERLTLPWNAEVTITIPADMSGFVQNPEGWENIAATGYMG